MGDSDLTDGTWLWPQGLVHYVKIHGVALPDEFVADARAKAGEVPGLSEAFSREWVVRGRHTIDWEYWKTWLLALEHPGDDER
jgi:hypothetical protein